jgi:predicted outer membrane repeat protein
LSVDGLQIFNNSSTGNGGAIFVTDNSTSPDLTTDTRTYFRDNSANGNGGAIYLAVNSPLKPRAIPSRAIRFPGRRSLRRHLQPGESRQQHIPRVSPNPEGITDGSGTVEAAFTTIEASNLLGSPSSISLSNSILQSVSCNSGVLDGGLNLQFGSALCPGSIPNMNPDLAATLADNGGLTPTIALPEGSPAIDAIPVPDCRDQARQQNYD